MKLELICMKDPHRQQLLDSGIGAALCALGAAGVSALAAGHDWEFSAPLAFIVILSLVSVVFGYRAGILGTLLAAGIFALFLFKPLGNLAVNNDTARANLGWMLLGGIAFSFLFAPSSSSFRRR